MRSRVEECSPGGTAVTPSSQRGRRHDRRVRYSPVSGMTREWLWSAGGGGLSAPDLQQCLEHLSFELRHRQEFDVTIREVSTAPQSDPPEILAMQEIWPRSTALSPCRAIRELQWLEVFARWRRRFKRRLELSSLLVIPPRNAEPRYRCCIPNRVVLCESGCEDRSPSCDASSWPALVRVGGAMSVAKTSPTS